MSALKAFKKQVVDKFGPGFMPSMPIGYNALPGDILEVHRKFGKVVLRPSGNITRQPFNIAMPMERKGGGGAQTLSSKSGYAIEAKVAGDPPAAGSTIPIQSAGLTISLKGESAFLFKFTSFWYDSAENAYVLKKAISESVSGLNFDSNEIWVVTDIMSCDAFSLVLSDIKDGKVELTAKAGVGVVDEASMLSLDAGLTATYSSSAAMSVEAPKGGSGIIVRFAGFRVKKSTDNKAVIAGESGEMLEEFPVSENDLLMAETESNG